MRTPSILYPTSWLVHLLQQQWLPQFHGAQWRLLFLTGILTFGMCGRLYAETEYPNTVFSTPPQDVDPMEIRKPTVRPDDPMLDEISPPVNNPKPFPSQPEETLGRPSSLSPQQPMDISDPGYSPNDSLHPLHGFVSFQPHDVLHHDLNLWMLESQKFFRSPAVISPDLSLMAYSEVVFMAGDRQVFSKLYLIPIPAVPSSSPNAQLVGPTPTISPLIQADAPPSFDGYQVARSLYTPHQHYKDRITLLQTGQDTHQKYGFETLTVVDWSPSGQRLLVKKRTGLTHLGLKTSDLIVYDRLAGTVSIYPEIKRAVEYFWDNTGVLPPLDSLSWDVEPLGWQPQSDSVVMFRAWAYDKRSKKYLGLWRYDMDSERSELMSTDQLMAPVQANGKIPVFTTPPPPPPPKRKWFGRG